VVEEDSVETNKYWDSDEDGEDITYTKFTFIHNSFADTDKSIFQSKSSIYVA